MNKYPDVLSIKTIQDALDLSDRAYQLELDWFGRKPSPVLISRAHWPDWNMALAKSGKPLIRLGEVRHDLWSGPVYFELYEELPILEHYLFHKDAFKKRGTYPENLHRVSDTMPEIVETNLNKIKQTALHRILTH